MKKIIVLSLLVIVATGLIGFQIVFNSVSTVNQSKNKWEWVESEQSLQANQFFWDQFHSGNYDTIPAILEKLAAAYLENPNDLKTIYHLGFTHFWALSERQHLDSVPGTIIDHATLALKYLGEAYKMNPDDARLLSFLSAAKIIVGSLSNDEGLIKDGYLNGLKSIRDWKDFGEFSLAYTLSRLPHTDPNSQKSLEWMEETTERCYCEDIDSKLEECKQKIAQMAENTTNKERDRIIPNSWVAPHNIEGYFMFYGDLLVKSGDWEKGKIMYQLAKQAPDYAKWDYKEVLENRIRNAEKNVELFRKEIANGEKVNVDQAIMINTSISCRTCHQMSKKEFDTKYAGFDQKSYLDQSFYFLD